MSQVSRGEIIGLHHVKIAVVDLPRSRAWYERVFDLEPMLEWPDEAGIVRGVRYVAKGGFALALRENADVARASAGFDPMVISVGSRDDVDAWAERLDELGIDHRPVVAGAMGFFLSFDDPDGLQLKIYAEESHGLAPTRARWVSDPATD